MPRNVIIRKESTRLLKAVGVMVGITLGVAVLMDIGAFVAIKARESAIVKQENSITSMSQTQRAVDINNAVKARRDYRLTVIKNLYETRRDTSRVINKIESLTPADMSLLSFNISEDGKINITANADSEQSVLSFYHDLKVDGFAKSVEFNAIPGTFGDSKGHIFNISFILNSGK